MDNEKEKYKTPKIKAYGTIQELTKGMEDDSPDSAGGGSREDHQFEEYFECYAYINAFFDKTL